MQDFEQSSPSCAGLDYLDIQPTQTDMRYSQDSTNTSPLNLETSAQSSTVLNLYPSGQPTLFNPATSYQPETSAAFYPPASSHIFSSLDTRPRLGTATAPTSGMAHAHRAQLPHPGTALSARDLYSAAVPSFPRAGHSTRSPSFPSSVRNLRHHPLSPTPSPGQTFTPPFKMESTSYGPKPQIPPLLDTTTFGTLQYADGPGAGHTVKADITGTIDKGFFLADDEWTCYRRNYFSCICSFQLSPHYPTSQVTFLQRNSTRADPVHGFAMSISAVVSDNENQVIELIQHTPKRDKGPIAKPEKIRLVPKPHQSATHHAMGLYGADSMAVGGRFDHNYGPPHPGYPNEHTFERIQFKQATANNGKRRAAQQYYHLVVELWADIGSSVGNEQYVKVAQRKSEKMIVRGRSPGHYQAERRGSASSGPGGSAGSLGFGGSHVMGSDFGSSGSTILPGGYGSTYDPAPPYRSNNHYNTDRHPQQHQGHDMASEHPVMSTDEVKAISETKDYQYFATPIYENSHDQRQPVEMFSHSNQRTEHDNVLPQMNPGGFDALSRMKHEASNDGSPSLYYTTNSFYANKCGRYEGKASSTGYYPSMAAPTSNMGMS